MKIQIRDFKILKKFLLNEKFEKVLDPQNVKYEMMFEIDKDSAWCRLSFLIYKWWEESSGALPYHFTLEASSNKPRIVSPINSYFEYLMEALKNYRKYEN